MTFKSVPSRRTTLCECVCAGAAGVRLSEEVGGFRQMLKMSLLFILFHFEKVTLSLSVSSLSLCLSDKLFGKRLLQAGRHIMSHKSWMKTVPTENCDVLMTFAGQALNTQTHVCQMFSCEEVTDSPRP